MTLRMLIIFTLTLISLSASAQVADRAGEISPLLIGETIPDLLVKAPDGSEHTMLNILSRKPTVILFYRGGWCPYCNAHLSEIRNAEDEIIQLGYQIIAISPDSPENLVATSGLILFEYINPNYKTRMSSRLLIAVLQNL